MGQPSNIALVERLYRAFAEGDLATMVAAGSADIVLEQDPSLPWGGRYEGPEGIAAFFRNLIETADTGITTDALFEAGDTVIQYGRSSGTVRANGETYDVPECHVWTLDGETVTRVQFFIDTPAMLAAIGR
jgi:ketosteroid isomerase-like protein